MLLSISFEFMTISLTKCRTLGEWHFYQRLCKIQGRDGSYASGFAFYLVCLKGNRLRIVHWFFFYFLFFLVPYLHILYSTFNEYTLQFYSTFSFHPKTVFSDEEVKLKGLCIDMLFITKMSDTFLISKGLHVGNEPQQQTEGNISWLIQNSIMSYNSNCFLKYRPHMRNHL